MRDGMVGQADPGKKNSFGQAMAISRDFSILLMSLAVGGLGFGILAPIMPVYAREVLHTDASGLGFAYALFAVAFAGFMLPAGYWADKIGRKQMIAGGLALFGVTTLALAFITDIYQFAVLRILEGMGAAMEVPAAFALVVDLVPESKRGIAMGAEGTAQLIGGLSGPAVGGFIAGQLGYNFAFYIASALAFTCSILVWQIRAPRVLSVGEKPSLLSIFGAWKRNAAKSRALTAVTGRGFVMGIVQGLWNLGLIVYWNDQIGLSETEIGIAMTIGVLTMMLGTLPFGAMSDARGRRPFILLGGGLMVTGLIFNVFATNVWDVFILVAVSDFGAAMSNPAVGAMLADVMSKEERGRVMGAYQMIQGIGNIVGFSLLGYIYEAISPESPIILCSFALMAATLIIALFVEETHVVHAEDKAFAPGSPASDLLDFDGK
jgi:MFS family permease